MNVAEELKAGIDAKTIWEGICSDDYVLVKEKMRVLTQRELVHVYGVVATELFNRKQTPGLDVIGKKILSDIGERVASIFADVYEFKHRLNELNEMPDSYQKYQGIMAHLGKDPLNYHEWVASQDTVDASDIVR